MNDCKKIVSDDTPKISKLATTFPENQDVAAAQFYFTSIALPMLNYFQATIDNDLGLALSTVNQALLGFTQFEKYSTTSFYLTVYAGDAAKTRTTLEEGKKRLDQSKNKGKLVDAPVINTTKKTTQQNLTQNFSSLTPNLGCVENWKCTPSGDCINGTTQQKCTDLNTCNTIRKKPADKTTCTETTTSLGTITQGFFDSIKNIFSGVFGFIYPHR